MSKTKKLSEVLIDIDDLRNNLSYDHENGSFTWLKSRRGIKAGSSGGGTLKNGYPTISFNRGRFYAHRLAWFYFYGVWPENEIDHINGDKKDFRISNLQDVSHQKNMENQKAKNNKHGHSGVALRKDGRWTARITVNKKSIQLGYFKNLSDASAAYIDAAKTLHTNNIQRFI